MKSVIDSVIMARGLMDGNQQPSVQHELERLFPSTRREVKPESFIGLVLMNHLLLQQLIQILVLQHRLPQNGRLQKHGDQKLEETPSKFAIFSM